MFDTIIIGSGPAGISTAIYLKRANLNILVITANNSTLKKVGRIENYYGFDSITGEELYEKGIEQARLLEIPINTEEVVAINKNNEFEIITNKNTYQAKTIVLATGINHTSIKIKNIEKYEGKGVSYCATCDGFFYKNKALGIIGDGDFAVGEIKHLLNITNKITIFTNGNKPNQALLDLNLPIIEEEITELIGDFKIEQIHLNNKRLIDIDGIFVAIGTAGSTNFAKTLGLITNKNYIVVNNKYQTNMKGLYAVGDCIGGFLQISKAVSDGACASIDIIKYIKENKN